MRGTQCIRPEWEWESGGEREYLHHHWLTRIAIQPALDPFRRILVDGLLGYGQTICG
jgi:hypothetical protein